MVIFVSIAIDAITFTPLTKHFIMSVYMDGVK